MSLYDSKITGAILISLIAISLVGTLSQFYQIRWLCSILGMMSLLNFMAYDLKKEERRRKSRLAKKIIHSEYVRLRH